MRRRNKIRIVLETTLCIGKGFEYFLKEKLVEREIEKLKLEGVEMKEIDVVIKIPIKSERQLDGLYKIEKKMRKVGISFDTGYDLENKVRHWNFDHSLKGAKVLFNEKVEK